jgi:hypothetical protein
MGRINTFTQSSSFAQVGDQRWSGLVPTALNIVGIDDPDDFRFAIGADVPNQYLCVYMADGRNQ